MVRETGAKRVDAALSLCRSDREPREATEVAGTATTRLNVAVGRHIPQRTRVGRWYGPRFVVEGHGHVAVRKIAGPNFQVACHGVKNLASLLLLLLLKFSTDLWA